MKKLFKTLTCALAALLAAVTFAGCQGDPGVNGKTPEFRVENGVFQWKYTTDTEWQDIVDIDDLKGAKGDKGDTGATGATGPQGEKGEDGVTPQVAIYENLFNKEEAQLFAQVDPDTGIIATQYKNSEGAMVNYSDKYGVSPKIEWVAGKTYVWKAYKAFDYIGGPAKKVPCYDAEDNFIGKAWPNINTEDGTIKLTMTENVEGKVPAYFRFNFDGLNVNEFMLVEGADITAFPSEYIAFGKTLIVLGDQTLILDK